MMFLDGVTLTMIRHAHASKGRGYAAAVMRQRWQGLSHDSALEIVDRAIPGTEVGSEDGARDRA